MSSFLLEEWPPRCGDKAEAHITRLRKAIYIVDTTGGFRLKRGTTGWHEIWIDIHKSWNPRDDESDSLAHGYVIDSLLYALALATNSDE